MAESDIIEYLAEEKENGTIEPVTFDALNDLFASFIHGIPYTMPDEDRDVDAAASRMWKNIWASSPLYESHRVMEDMVRHLLNIAWSSVLVQSCVMEVFLAMVTESERVFAENFDVDFLQGDDLLAKVHKFTQKAVEEANIKARGTENIFAWVALFESGKYKPLLCGNCELLQACIDGAVKKVFEETAAIGLSAQALRTVSPLLSSENAARTIFRKDPDRVRRWAKRASDIAGCYPLVDPWSIHATRIKMTLRRILEAEGSQAEE